MRKLTGWMVALLAASTVLLSANDASAAFKLGIDGMWVPVAAPSLETEGGFSTDPDHDIASFGAAGHALLGFDIFSTGLKLNYFSSGFEEAGESERQNELDINAMARIQIPTTPLAFWAEGGLATTTEFETYGYNFGGAIEYGILQTMLLDLNLGIMGQYYRLPEIDVGSVEQVELTEIRGIAFIGFDFGI